MGRYVKGKCYQAGDEDVTITWRDGTRSTYAAHSLFTLEDYPREIAGKLFRVKRGGKLEYEVPLLVPPT